MNQNVGLKILNCTAVFVIIGGCYDMLMPAVPFNLLSYLGVTKAELSPHLSALLLGVLRALGGCLLAIGIAALLIINGPVRRGERWAAWTLVILVGLSEGINASQMCRFGSPYYAPLAFVALTVVGVLLLPRPSEAKL